MNEHDDEQRYDPRLPQPAPGGQRRHAEPATRDPSWSGVHAQGPAPTPDAATAATEAANRGVAWLRPSELPNALLATALSEVVDRSLTAQSKARRSLVRAPSVGARVMTRRIASRRASRRARGVDR